MSRAQEASKILGTYITCGGLVPFPAAHVTPAMPHVDTTCCGSLKFVDTSCATAVCSAEDGKMSNDGDDEGVGDSDNDTEVDGGSLRD